MRERRRRVGRAAPQTKTCARAALGALPPRRVPQWLPPAQSSGRHARAPPRGRLCAHLALAQHRAVARDEHKLRLRRAQRLERLLVPQHVLSCAGAKGGDRRWWRRRRGRSAGATGDSCPPLGTRRTRARPARAVQRNARCKACAAVAETPLRRGAERPAAARGGDHTAAAAHAPRRVSRPRLLVYAPLFITICSFWLIESADFLLFFGAMVAEETAHLCSCTKNSCFLIFERVFEPDRLLSRSMRRLEIHSPCEQGPPSVHSRSSLCTGFGGARQPVRRGRSICRCFQRTTALLFLSFNAPLLLQFFPTGIKFTRLFGLLRCCEFHFTTFLSI